MCITTILAFGANSIHTSEWKLRIGTSRMNLTVGFIYSARSIIASVRILSVAAIVNWIVRWQNSSVFNSLKLWRTLMRCRCTFSVDTFNRFIRRTEHRFGLFAFHDCWNTKTLIALNWSSNWTYSDLLTLRRISLTAHIRTSNGSVRRTLWLNTAMILISYTLTIRT